MADVDSSFIILTGIIIQPLFFVILALVEIPSTDKICKFYEKFKNNYLTAALNEDYISNKREV